MEWFEPQLHCINNFFGRIFRAFETKKTDEDGNWTANVESAVTSVSYMCGLKGAFKPFYKFDIDITKGKVFRNTYTGVYHVIDKIFKEKQAQGNSSRSHNVLTTDDIIKLYGSHRLSKYPTAGIHCEAYI